MLFQKQMKPKGKRKMLRYEVASVIVDWGMWYTSPWDRLKRQSVKWEKNNKKITPSHEAGSAGHPVKCLVIGLKWGGYFCTGKRNYGSRCRMLWSRVPGILGADPRRGAIWLQSLVLEPSKSDCWDLGQCSKKRQVLSNFPYLIWLCLASGN